jgi:hypothetical protein
LHALRRGNRTFDGIRVLQNAVEVLQHDVRAIRGDITSLKEINARVRQTRDA